ncbi:MAG: transposase [Blastochloris sp.]|nr:transposase [Blastochloris sp.]
MSGKKKRRVWTSSEKLRIVLAGLEGSAEISELCRREGINPTLYYGWKRQLQGSAAKVFGEQDRKASAKEERLAAENAKLKSVVVEITTENLELKKRALELEDHGQLPSELQRAVHAEVVKTKERSGWPVKRTLRCLGVSPASYYRWRKEAEQKREVESCTRQVRVYEATSAEQEAVRTYALKHPGIRHRELAWRMVDEDVACLSPSTVYRILKAKTWFRPGGAARNANARRKRSRRAPTKSGRRT